VHQQMPQHQVVHAVPHNIELLEITMAVIKLIVLSRIVLEYQASTNIMCSFLLVFKVTELLDKGKMEYLSQEIKNNCRMGVEFEIN
jgi:hypothetical protein